MIIKLRYKNIDDTLQKLILQVSDSIQYMRYIMPDDVKDPEDVFYWLKGKTMFVEDPPKTELLQTSQTLFENNYHGIAGAGDCDCMSITGTAALYILNYPVKIVLAGRSMKMPVHIYLLVLDKNIWQPFDLTEKKYKKEREYRYKFSYLVPYPKKNISPKILNDTDFSIKRKKILKNYLTF